MITFKEDVAIKDWTPALHWMMTCLARMQSVAGFPDEFTVTSINDGLHSTKPLSRHYTDEAWDIRSHNFKDMATKTDFLNRYRHELNNGEGALRPNAFTVLHEYIGTPKEHFHAQVKKGETYP